MLGPVSGSMTLTKVCHLLQPSRYAASAISLGMPRYACRKKKVPKALTSAQSLMYLVYRESFVAGNKGYASAIVVWTVLLIGLVTLVQFIGQKKWVNYEV